MAQQKIKDYSAYIETVCRGLYAHQDLSVIVPNCKALSLAAQFLPRDEISAHIGSFKTYGVLNIYRGFSECGLEILKNSPEEGKSQVTIIPGNDEAPGNDEKAIIRIEKIARTLGLLPHLN